MIIKEINIRSFAGIKDKNITLDKGLNLIYGENEKGKSSIQAFIKLWIYGILKGDRVSRERYLPLDGGIMDGDLNIDHEEIEYIIKRRFGKSKKEDYLEIIDKLTGEKIDLKGKEFGEYILGVSEKTFSKTVFINQQGVEIIKEKKEDQIKERLQNTFTSENNEVSVGKAIENLKEKKKEIQNSRKSGILDRVSKEIEEKIRERYKTNKAIEENLEIELSLNIEKANKNNIKLRLEKLEIYKKHIKKVSLKREYEDILKYFDRSKKAKEEKLKLKEELMRDNFEINLEYLDKVEGEIGEYSNLEEKLDEQKSHKDNLINSKEFLEKENEEHDVFVSLGGKVKEKLIRLKADIDFFNEKLENEKKLYRLINIEEEKLALKEKNLRDLNKIKNNLHYCKELIAEEKDFKKYYVENKKNININMLIGAIILIILGVCSFLILKNMLIGSILIVLGVGLTYIIFLKKDKGKRDKKNSDKIGDIEKKLKEFNCTEMNIKLVEEFLKEEEKINFLIEERLNRIEDLNLDEGRDRHNQNEKMLDSILSMTSSKDIEELYLKVEDYDRRKDKIDIIKNEMLELDKNIDGLNFQLTKVKEKILEDTLLIDEAQTVKDAKNIIENYKIKSKKKKELDNDLQNIQETYETLLKDRNIEEIKKELEFNELKDELSEYSKEEEIEKEIKSFSNKLLESEKKIKVLEGEIKLSLNGFRDINIVSEEIFELQEKRSSLEKKFKAINIALDGLEKVERVIKEKFAPEINKRIGEIFEKLTEGKYRKVILKQDYSLEVEGERWFNSKYLSNGTKDQIYLALRLAIIEVIFKEIEVPVIFDEIFLQYDDNRREVALKYLSNKISSQNIIFTCQRIEENILNKNKIKYKKVLI